MDYTVKAERTEHGLKAENRFELPNGKTMRVRTAKNDSGAVQTSVCCGTTDRGLVCGLFSVAYGPGGDFTKVLHANYVRATPGAIEAQHKAALEAYLDDVKAEALAYYAAQAKGLS